MLRTHDRYGRRIDEVELDPSWHWLLRGAIEREVHSLPWRSDKAGGHVVRGALFMLWGNANDGVMCPVSMTYAAVAALRDGAPELAAEWEPRLTRPDYDSGALAGMAMTERQGGSDVRANITRADPVGAFSGALNQPRFKSRISGETRLESPADQTSGSISGRHSGSGCRNSGGHVAFARAQHPAESRR